MKIVKEKKGKYLSSKNDICNVKLNFICKKGHKFTSSSKRICSGSWCHACKTGKHSIETMQELAAKYDGECLSTEYANRITKLKWRCKDGHEFIKAPSNIISKKVFCFECYKNERYG